MRILQLSIARITVGLVVICLARASLLPPYRIKRNFCPMRITRSIAQTRPLPGGAEVPFSDIESDEARTNFQRR